MLPPNGDVEALAQLAAEPLPDHETSVFWREYDCGVAKDQAGRYLLVFTSFDRRHRYTFELNEPTRKMITESLSGGIVRPEMVVPGH